MGLGVILPRYIVVILIVLILFFLSAYFIAWVTKLGAEQVNETFENITEKVRP